MTKLLRVKTEAGNNRLTAKQTPLQGEPTSWKKEPPKNTPTSRQKELEELHEQTTDETLTLGDHDPNKQQQADHLRKEEERMLQEMMRDEEYHAVEEGILQETWANHQRERGTRAPGKTTQQGNPQTRRRAETPSQDDLEEINVLAEQQETPESMQDRRKNKRFKEATEEARKLAQLTDPLPRTKWAQNRHDRMATRTDKRTGPPPTSVGVTDKWLDSYMEQFKKDQPLYKLSNRFWKKATFAERKTILKCKLDWLLPMLFKCFRLLLWSRCLHSSRKYCIVSAEAQVTFGIGTDRFCLLSLLQSADYAS